MWRKYLNSFLARLSYHNGLLKPLNKPNLFAVETTSVCNLECIMCPYPIMKRPKGFIDEALFKKIMDRWAGTSYLIRLHGLGEPLLDKRIAALINYAGGRGVRTEISSNCTAMTADRAREILSSKLFQIILSLDGAHKSTYEHIRKKGDFDRVTANIETFLRLKEETRSPVRAVLQIILMNETVGEVDEFMARWAPYKQRGILNEFRIKRFSTWAGQVEGFQAMADAKLRYYPEAEPKRVPCFYLWESVVALQDGRVTPCCFDYEGKVILGDLKTQSFEEVWHGQKMRDLRRRHLEGDFDNELCRNCREYPRTAFAPGYPLNRAGLKSVWTWIQILMGRKQVIENIPVDVTPP